MDSVNTRTRTIYGLYETIDTSTALDLIKSLDLLNRTRGPINLIFSTTGGSVTDGIIMYEAIRRSKNPVTVTVTGAVESIGAFIIQGAHRRRIEPTAYIMYHSGTFQTQETAVDEVVREAMFARDQYRMVDKIIHDRIKFKGSLDSYQESVRRSIWLDARGALKNGYVDEVVE